MKTTRLTIDLPQPLKAFVDEQVAKGGFATAADYIWELLLEAQRQKVREHLDQLLLAGLNREHVEQLLLAGLNSGPATPMTAQDWEDLRQSLRNRIAENQKNAPKNKKKSRSKT